MYLARQRGVHPKAVKAINGGRVTIHANEGRIWQPDTLTPETSRAINHDHGDIMGQVQYSGQGSIEERWRLRGLALRRSRRKPPSQNARLGLQLLDRWVITARIARQTI
jgi:hypothetical protein